MKWYLKQLFPLTYRSRFRLSDGSQMFSVWKMWFGHQYQIQTYKITLDSHATVTHGGNRNMKDKLTAAEAVYGFCGWLTTREVKTIMSASDDAAPIATLIDQFCKENKLQDPRDGWDNNLIHPSGECSGAAT